MLGELQLCRGADVLTLPASRKTRALLAYLAVTGARHRRSTLCDLFWEDALDPRAALRWSLTQLRHALGAHDGSLIQADRDAVALDRSVRVTDLAQAFVGLPEASSEPAAPLEALDAAIDLFRGAFLDGLDLPDCYAYHEWCMAGRDAAGARHEQLLVAQIEALRGAPERALAPAGAGGAQPARCARAHRADAVAAEPGAQRRCAGPVPPVLPCF